MTGKYLETEIILSESASSVVEANIIALTSRRCDSPGLVYVPL